MRQYTVEGMVLGRRNFSEKDRLVTLLTPTHGLVTVLAKGVRRPGSRLAGNVELCSHIKAFIAPGRSLDVLSQVEGLSPKPVFGAAIERMGAAFYIFEIVKRLAQEGEENYPLFRLVKSVVDRLPLTNEYPMLISYFEYRFLLLLGFGPNLAHCAVTSRALHPGQVVWDTHERLLCDGTTDLVGNRYLRLQQESLQMLRFFDENKSKPAPTANKALVEAEVRMMTHAWIEALCERKLGTRDFLTRLQKMA